MKSPLLCQSENCSQNNFWNLVLRGKANRMKMKKTTGCNGVTVISFVAFGLLIVAFFIHLIGQIVSEIKVFIVFGFAQ